jgi:dihydrofolate reductase
MSPGTGLRLWDMKLTLTTFLTVDGVMQSPGAPDEDPADGFDRGGWLVPYADDDMGAFITETFARAGAFLLGRRTYEIFAGHWPNVPDENAVAAALNRLPKHVVSTTLDNPAWGPVSIIDGDVIGQVSALKQQPGGELQVHGSGALARSLIEAELIDTYQLLVFPVHVGSGRRLFADPGPAGGLRLIDSRTTSTGVAIQTYEPAGELRQGSFAEDAEPESHRILR